MMRVVGKARAALLVFGTALLVLVAPGVALAHQSGPPGHVGDAQSRSLNVGYASFAASCPAPGGHVCGCGNLEALARASATAAAPFARWIIGATLRAPAKRSFVVASASPLVSFSSARPRAPPQAV